MSQPDEHYDEDPTDDDDALTEYEGELVRADYIPTRVKVTAVMVLILVFIAGVGVNVLYTDRVNTAAEKRSIAAQKQLSELQAESALAWCGIISVFLDVYKTTPPTSPAGIAVQRGFEQLYRAYHCE